MKKAKTQNYTSIRSTQVNTSRERSKIKSERTKTKYLSHEKDLRSQVFLEKNETEKWENESQQKRVNREMNHRH